MVATDGVQMACDRIEYNDKPFGSIVLPMAAVRLVEKLIVSGKATRVYMTASMSKATLYLLEIRSWLQRLTVLTIFRNLIV